MSENLSSDAPVKDTSSAGAEAAIGTEALGVSEGQQAGLTLRDEGGHRLPERRNLRPFFSFYGGKWRDALKLYDAPTHAVVVEPFAGSAGYALRHYDRRVVLCEKDPIIAGLWNYLIKVSAAEIRAIPDAPLDGTIDDMNLPCEEQKWLVGFWLNRAASQPRNRPSKWMRDKIREGSFWGTRVRETVASQVDAIRHWQVYQDSYGNCPVYGEATWFIDPPYQKAGTHYKHGSDGLDYEALATWCKDRKGQVIVCENEGADWLPFEELASTKTTRAGRRSKEAVWKQTKRDSQSGDMTDLQS